MFYQPRVALYIINPAIVGIHKCTPFRKSFSPVCNNKTKTYKKGNVTNQVFYIGESCTLKMQQSCGYNTYPVLCIAHFNIV